MRRALALLAALLCAGPAAAQARRAWRVEAKKPQRSLVVWPDCSVKPLVGRWRGTMRCGQEPVKVFEALLYQAEGEENVLRLETWVGETWRQESDSGLSGVLSAKDGVVSFAGEQRALIPFLYDMALTGTLTFADRVEGDEFNFTGALTKHPTDRQRMRLRVAGRKARAELRLLLADVPYRCLVSADRLHSAPVRGCR